MKEQNEIKERPILFSGEMIRAILEGRKTQTRRRLKQKAIEWLPTLSDISVAAKPSTGLCQYGYPGDLLWVRETWGHEYGGGYLYRASHGHMTPGDNRWRPSIHMPRAVSRIMLEITDVRCERLQDISENDAISEGIKKASHGGQYPWFDYQDETYILGSAQESFKTLWQSINGTESWDVNPWVWVITFKRIEP